MRHEDLVLQKTVDMLRHFWKCRRSRNHIVVDTSQLLDKPGYWSIRVDERLPGMQHFLPIVNEDGDFRDASTCGIASGGLNIYDGVQHQDLLD